MCLHRALKRDADTKKCELMSYLSDIRYNPARKIKGY